MPSWARARLLVRARLVLCAVLLALGMRQPYALISYILCGFVTGMIAQDFYKGVRARQAIHASFCDHRNLESQVSNDT